MGRHGLEEEMQEEAHLLRVLRAFLSYSNRMKRLLRKQLDDWNRLSSDEQALIPEYQRKLASMADLFDHNQLLFNEIVKTTLDCNTELFKFSQVSHLIANQDGREEFVGDAPTDRDFENCRSTLRQMVRDWSDEGAQERNLSYSPILTALQELFPLIASRAKVRILNPGAGLGRLAWEMLQLGFSVQGNEFSHYMLLPSQYILNFCGQIEAAFKIHPFVYPLSNHRSQQDSFRAFQIPDCVPGPGPDPRADFSMTAGDFLEVYTAKDEIGAWNCIVTCFFLDTAPNVLKYLRVIWDALRDHGGIWINLGPLQYHFEGSSEQSIELTWEEIKLAAERIGFRFSREQVMDDWMSYAHDPLSLSKTSYRPVFSVASKDLKIQQ